MSDSKSKLGIGASLPRKEDARHLAGRGQFVADIHVPGVREIAFVRSPVAHGRLTGVTKPAGSDGRVFVAADLELAPMRVVPDIPGFKPSDYDPLARDKVRFTGECVAACLGGTRAEAEDLAQEVVADIEPLPAVADTLIARDAPPALVHDGWGDNVYVERTVEGGDIDSVRGAPVIVTHDYRMNRQSTVPMEGRAVLAYWDERLGELVVYMTTQIPHLTRTGLAQALGVPDGRIHVIAPDIGGGFGGKARLMAEEVVTCAIAWRTRRPVRWIEDRREHLIGAVQVREHVYRVTAYADDRGIIQGIDAEVTVDAGAYSLWHTGPFMETGMAIGNLPGPYRIRHFRARSWTVATNKPPLGVFRGVARPGACFAIERTIDEVARAVGRDPLDVRIDNLVTSAEMPYRTVTDMLFDTGDYPEAARRVAKLVDYDAVRARQGDADADGRRIGIGLAMFTEQSAHGMEEWVKRRTPIIPGYESATARLLPDGTLHLLVGVQSHGQGMETTFAQVAHQELGIHPDNVTVRHGDTALSPFGMGTFGSRSMVMGGGAVFNACAALRARMAPIAAHLLQCKADEIAFADSEARGPGGSVTLAEIGRVAHLRQDALPPGTDPVLDVTATYQPEVSSGAFSYAIHAAVVAVDIATGAVDLVDFAVVEDCGTVVNPMIVDGQIVGGVAQGIGTALYEETPYDDNGQPLATTFADYRLPGTTEIPDIRIGHMVTPATSTRYGMKGMGEGGAIAPPAAIANAVRDALAAAGIDVQINETPVTPRRVRQAIDS